MVKMKIIKLLLHEGRPLHSARLLPLKSLVLSNGNVSVEIHSPSRFGGRDLFIYGYNKVELKKCYLPAGGVAG